MLETSVEMGLQAETSNDAVVMAVDVGVDAIEALEDLFDGGLEGRRERHSWVSREDVCVREKVRCPGEEVGDVAGSGKTDGTRELWRVVPQVLEPGRDVDQQLKGGNVVEESSYSSVAFISGHECGLQNSVIAPYSKLIWL